MKIYLAARYSRHAEMAYIARLLTRHGHQVTSRWINGGHENREEADTALEDLADVLACDCLVSFTDEPGAQTRGRGGRHVEFGLGLASGKLMILVGQCENVFHALPGLHRCETLAQMLDCVDRLDALEKGATCVIPAGNTSSCPAVGTDAVLALDPLAVHAEELDGAPATAPR